MVRMSILIKTLFLEKLTMIYDNLNSLYMLLDEKYLKQR